MNKAKRKLRQPYYGLFLGVLIVSSSILIFGHTQYFQLGQLAIAQSTNNAPSTPETNVQQYRNDRYGISIGYLPGWTVREDDSDVVGEGLKNIVTIIAPGGIDNSNDYHNYLAISIDPKVDTNDIGTYLSEVLDGFRSDSSFHYIESDTNALLAGQPAFRLIYNYSDGTTNVQMSTIFGDKGYTINYGADADKFASYSPIFCAMISTFQANFGQGGSCDQQGLDSSQTNPSTTPPSPSTQPNDNNSMPLSLPSRYRLPSYFI